MIIAGMQSKCLVYDIKIYGFRFSPSLNARRTEAPEYFAFLQQTNNKLLSIQ